VPVPEPAATAGAPADIREADAAKSVAKYPVGQGRKHSPLGMGIACLSGSHVNRRRADHQPDESLSRPACGLRTTLPVLLSEPTPLHQ
jgi:hypothetical protein